MKKLFAVLVILLALMFVGCTGLNTSVAVNVATDTAFVMALQNNPAYKVPVVIALKEVKAVLTGSITYDDLIIQITKAFGPKYAVLGVILSGYIAQDKPIFETYLPMLESYKVGILTKIDRFILLASI
ncbi:MAG: hypothetical protein IMZ53_13185 [Thermoplasmata archaeon]|nr:hypothetical protein [Thermoplasmata archaeon]